MTTNPIASRFEQAYIELTPTQIALAITLITAVSFALMFVQEPLVHDSMHNFRHVAGITCH